MQVHALFYVCIIHSCIHSMHYNICMHTCIHSYACIPITRQMLTASWGEPEHNLQQLNTVSSPQPFILLHTVLQHITFNRFAHIIFELLFTALSKDCATNAVLLTRCSLFNSTVAEEGKKFGGGAQMIWRVGHV